MVGAPTKSAVRPLLKAFGAPRADSDASSRDDARERGTANEARQVKRVEFDPVDQQMNDSNG
jgi:hypothetical protein